MTEIEQNSEPDLWHNVTIRIPFSSSKHASIAKQVIEVDSELQPSVVKRELQIQDNELVATFTCLTVRLVRLSANSFLDNVELVIRTLGEFAEEAEHNSTL